MISTNEFSAIAALDLEPIKMKLMHKEAGEGWSLEQVNVVEREYRRFLYLMKTFPHEQTAPRVDVDTFWHCHILDTMKYAADCEQVFGYFLHHYPYIGLRGESDNEVRHSSGERMRELYEETFGEKYIREVADTDVQATIAYCGVTGAKTAYCGETAAKTAYCGVTGANTAYCGVTGAKTAYCGVTGAKTAYCGVTGAKTAYCGVTGAKTAYCGVTGAKTAYCGVTGAKTAYCGVTGAKTAYCGVTGTKTAYCGVAA